MNCSSLKCKKGISLDDERIEISTSEDQQNKCKLNISWSGKGDAVFHPKCWEELLKASRSRNPKNDSFNLSQLEKNVIKDAAKAAEKYDSLSTINKEAIRVANMIKKSSHCCAFTGAGISTSAGIGDYRGKKGKWTEMDRTSWKEVVGEASGSADEEPSAKKRKTSDNDESTDESDNEVEEDGVPYETLRPTYTHEALKKLIDLGLLKYIISQNGDGLHGLSGVPSDHISELHGNVFIEKCESCDHRYSRPYYVMDDVSSEYYEEIEDYGKTDIIKPRHAKQCDLCRLSHRTGRKCVQKKSSGKKCPGHLMDTIINFRDNLEESILDKATEHAEKCDLMLSLGTTMTVTPACDLVEMGQYPLRLVICNRQKTTLDSVCLEKKERTKETLGSRIFGDCDTFMKEVMKNIFRDKELKNWEDGRNERLKSYDQQRDNIKS